MTERTVAEKARVRPGTTIAVIDGQPEIVDSLGLPEGVRFVATSQAQLVFLFVARKADLEEKLPAAVREMGASAALWVFFRKGSASAGLDMSRNDVWAVAERLELRPLGLVSVDATWSAFRLKRAPAAASE
jgi:hypothetical protein